MLLLMSLLIILVIYFFKNKKFKQGSYYKITHNSFLFTIFDAGRNGEYQIYKRLRDYERKGGKFLFNCYLPKDNGETTEIDVLLINSNGIYVFESKNYSGWIFGDEKAKNWTQVLPKGRGRSHKEQFFNPIIQNKVHIKWLRSLIGEEVPVYSIIAFSERCTLKKINVTSQDVQVINRQMIFNTVRNTKDMQSRQLSMEEVNELYNKLYPFTQVSEEQKIQHIQNINLNYGKSQDKDKTSKTNTYKVKDTTSDKITLNSKSLTPNRINPQLEGTTAVHIKSKVPISKDKISLTSTSQVKKSTLDYNVPEAEGTTINNSTVKSKALNVEVATASISNDAETQICPKCGAKLVLRTAKKGANEGKQFYGCSNFPKCRYIR